MIFSDQTLGSQKLFILETQKGSNIFLGLSHLDRFKALTTQLKYFICELIIKNQIYYQKKSVALVMNKIYLDQDRTIQAEISSDASIQADESSGRDKKITTKNLSTQFSLYIEQIKRELSRHLNAISRDFYSSISIFLDEQMYAQKGKKNNLGETLKNWKPKLEEFQRKLEELRLSMPYFSGQKTKPRLSGGRKIKFPQIVDKYVHRIQHEQVKNQTSSKVNLQRQLTNAQSLYDQGRYEEAVIKAKEITKTNHNPQANFLLGNCYKAIGYYHDAIHEYDKAIKISPKGCYYNNRGNCYLCLQEMLKAEQDYKRAIKQEPNNDVFLGNYGNVCLSLKKYEQAIISYNLALKAGPPNDFFYNNRAFAQIKLRKFDQAIQSYNQAIHLNPNNHVYYKNRANLHMQKGNTEKAINDINDAIQIEPNKHDYFFLKGKWQYYSKRPREALMSLRRACELQPSKKVYMDYYMAIKDELTRK